MLRLAFVTALLALVNCEFKEVNTIEGQWTAIKVYPDIPLKADCEPITVELTSDQCNLGKKIIPVFNMTNAESEIKKVPIIPMDTKENDIEEAFAHKCVCTDEKMDIETLFAFRYLSDNYFLVYTSNAGSEMALLVAKDVPTKEELEEFERNSTVLSDEEGTIMCTKDKKTNTRKASNKFAANKNTATTHWMNYRPNKITTTTEPSTD